VVDLRFLRLPAETFSFMATYYTGLLIYGIIAALV
jgi:hypothetical protein